MTRGLSNGAGGFSPVARKWIEPMYESLLRAQNEQFEGERLGLEILRRHVSRPDVTFPTDALARVAGYLRPPENLDYTAIVSLVRIVRFEYDHPERWPDDDEVDEVLHEYGHFEDSLPSMSIEGFERYLYNMLFAEEPMERNMEGWTNLTMVFALNLAKVNVLPSPCQERLVSLRKAVEDRSDKAYNRWMAAFDKTLKGYDAEGKAETDVEGDEEQEDDDGEGDEEPEDDDGEGDEEQEDDDDDNETDGEGDDEEQVDDGDDDDDEPDGEGDEEDDETDGDGDDAERSHGTHAPKEKVVKSTSVCMFLGGLLAGTVATQVLPFVSRWFLCKFVSYVSPVSGSR